MSAIETRKSLEREADKLWQQISELQRQEENIRTVIGDVEKQTPGTEIYLQESSREQTYLLPILEREIQGIETQIEMTKHELEKADDVRRSAQRQNLPEAIKASTARHNQLKGELTLLTIQLDEASYKRNLSREKHSNLLNQHLTTIGSLTSLNEELREINKQKHALIKQRDALVIEINNLKSSDEPEPNADPTIYLSND